MSEETKEAIRLLIEALDECRLHDKFKNHVTNQAMKDRAMAFLVNRGLEDAKKAEEVLRKPSE